jgi:hypothetical protein
LRVGEPRAVDVENCLIACFSLRLAFGGKRRCVRRLVLRWNFHRWTGWKSARWNHGHRRNDGRATRKLAPRNGRAALAIHESPRLKNGYKQSQERNYRIRFPASTLQIDISRIQRASEISSSWPRLVHARKRLYLEFERLRILPLDLHFGLQFLDQQVKAGDFRTQLLYVRARRRRAA